MEGPKNLAGESGWKGEKMGCLGRGWICIVCGIEGRGFRGGEVLSRWDWGVWFVAL